MTDKPPFLSFIADEAKKWAARTTFAGFVAVLVLLVTPLKARLADIWHSPDQLAEISAKLDALSEEVLKATGENRVIHEVAGLSYVVEPVHLGEDITLNIVTRRTRTGAACVAISRTAVFTDSANVSVPGEPVPAGRQGGLSETAFRLSLKVPKEVPPGRVTVYLSLEFECGGKRVFDTTQPVAFMLLPQPVSETE